MLGDERNPNACVGLNNIEHYLGADVLQQILNVVADERVIIYSPPAAVEVFRSLMFIIIVHVNRQNIPQQVS